MYCIMSEAGDGAWTADRSGRRDSTRSTEHQGSGFRVQGSGSRVQGAGFRVQVSGFRVQGVGVSTDVPLYALFQFERGRTGVLDVSLNALCQVRRDSDRSTDLAMQVPDSQGVSLGIDIHKS